MNAQKGMASLLVALALTACAPKGEELYARAQQSLEKGDVRAAVIDLKSLVDDEPQNARARALLGLAFVEVGDVGAGEIEIRKAADLGADAAVLLVPQCTLQAAKGEFEAVLSGCDPNSAQGDDRVRLQIAQGRALLGQQRFPEARSQFEAALATQPDRMNAILGLAAVTDATDGLPAAKAVMEQAPESVRKQPRYWLTLGGIDARLGDLPAAEAAFQKAVDLGEGPQGSELYQALASLADTQMRNGKLDEAAKNADRLTKIAPQSTLGKQLSAQIAAAKGDVDKARTLLEEVVAANPENFDARLLLGVVNMQQGNLGQAEMHLSAVVANQPDNANAQRLLAELRARQESPEKSLEQLKPLLDQGSADPTLLAMGGRLSLASGDRTQALQYLAQATAQTAQRPSPQLQLEIANGFVAAGDLDRAIEVLEAMPKTGETASQREYLLLLALLRDGQKDKALSEGKALVDRSPKDAEARSLYGSVLTVAGQNDAARTQFNEALKLDPGHPRALASLARLDLKEGRPADAEKSFRRMLEANPKDVSAALGMAAAAGARGDLKEAEKWVQQVATDNPESAEAQLVLAQFYMGTREFDKALAVIDGAAKKAPNDAKLSNARGFVLLARNDVSGAIASFKQATAQAPKEYSYALNLAQARFRTGDAKGALDTLDVVLKAEPKFVPALALAAGISLQSKQVEKAAGYVERLRQVMPEAAGTYMLDGDVAMAQKRYRDALAFYRKAHALGANRQLVIAEYNAARLAGEQQPEKVLQDWVAAHPADGPAVVLLAEVLSGKGDRKGAIRLYETLLAKAPGDALILNNLAVLYQLEGNPKAVSMAEQAHKAAPKEPAIQDTYGWVLFQDGQTEHALELLEEAHRGMPENAEVQYHYAAALAKSGKAQEAIPLLQKAVRGSMPEDQKAAAQKLLQELKK